MSERAIFLDRDGVLNALIYYADTQENESPRIADHMQIFPDVGPQLRRLRDAGWALVLTTNQPSFAKGKTSLEDLQAVHEVLVDYLRAEDVSFLGYYQCYCHPQAIVAGYGAPCECRKPAPGMLLQAQQMHDINLAQSWMVGDSDSDVLCGQAAGTRTILLDYPLSASKRAGQCTPDYSCHTLFEAVDIILDHTEDENL